MQTGFDNHSLQSSKQNMIAQKRNLVEIHVEEADSMIKFTDHYNFRKVWRTANKIFNKCNLKSKDKFMN